MNKIFLVILGIAIIAFISTPPSASAINCQAPYSQVRPLELCGRPVPPEGCLDNEEEQELLGRSLCILTDTNQPSSPGTPTDPNAPIPPPQLPDSQVPGFTPETFVTDLISQILPIILGIAGFITVIFIIISGIQFMTSSGNPESAGAARGRLTFAIIGFVIIILAFAITQIVARIFLGETGVF